MKLLKTVIMLFILHIVLYSQVDTTSEHYYLFTYFINGEDFTGARLALSSDGINWQLYNNANPVIIPEVGSESRMRDPQAYFDRGTETFHLIWTTGWNGTNIGHATSKDLINWSAQKAIEVGAKIPDCACCWAPEIFFDDIQQKYMIYWSTERGTNGKRGYYSLTNDFETFTDPVLFCDPGYSVIDFSLIKVADGNYYMFFKDEREAMEAGKPSKNIHYVHGPTPHGPWSEVSETISLVGVEGPNPIKIGDEYRVYFDCYAQPAGQYRMVSVKDITTPGIWPQGPILKNGSADFLFSHGYINEIPRKYVMHLLFNGPAPDAVINPRVVFHNRRMRNVGGTVNVFNLLGRNIMTSQMNDYSTEISFRHSVPGMVLMHHKDANIQHRILTLE